MVQNVACIFVYTTFPDSVSATRVARLMVEQKLAGCVNIFPLGQSFYLWEGEVRDEKEVVVIFKTMQKQWVEIRDALKDEHPYEVPVIAAIPAGAANAGFLQWLESQVS